MLNIIHVNEYLWDAVNALLGETHAGRTDWIRPKLVLLLEGKTMDVITALEEAAATATCTETQRKALLRTSGDYRRNQPHMGYDHYLAQGWPIGTGVVEGACGHLVKDRMEKAGMRWTIAGAQAVLDLRAVRLNGDWGCLLDLPSSTAAPAFVCHSARSLTGRATSPPRRMSDQHVLVTPK